jgi:hypothetical protein
MGTLTPCGPATYTFREFGYAAANSDMERSGSIDAAMNGSDPGGGKAGTALPSPV